MILYGGDWVTSADPDRTSLLCPYSSTTIRSFSDECVALTDSPALGPGDRQEYYRNTLHRTYGAVRP